MNRHLKMALMIIGICLLSLAVVCLYGLRQKPSPATSASLQDTKPRVSVGKDVEADLKKVVEEAYWGLWQIVTMVSGNCFEEVENGAIIFHLGGPTYIRLTREKFETLHGISLLDHWREQLLAAGKKSPQESYFVREKLKVELIKAMREYGTLVDPNHLPPWLTRVENLRQQMLESAKK